MENEKANTPRSRRSADGSVDAFKATALNDSGEVTGYCWRCRRAPDTHYPGFAGTP
jgi:hypothetical protein